MADFGTHLSRLQMLKLSKNEITTVVDEAFSKLTRLSQLDLSYNRLRRLNELTFDGLVSLRLLYLNQNQIEILDRYTFHELKNLVTLSLADNKIKFLSGDQFTPLSSIQYLSIQNNLLQTPATGWFKATDLRSTIDTEGNKWNCDCSIIPFYNFLSNDISSLQRKMIGIVCQSPLYLAETRLIDLELSDLTCETNSHLMKNILHHQSQIFGLVALIFIFRWLVFSRTLQDLKTFHEKTKTMITNSKKAI